MKQTNLYDDETPFLNPENLQNDEIIEEGDEATGSYFGAFWK
jgi:hypothetical protein